MTARNAARVLCPNHKKAATSVLLRDLFGTAHGPVIRMPIIIVAIAEEGNRFGTWNGKCIARVAASRRPSYRSARVCSCSEADNPNPS